MVEPAKADSKPYFLAELDEEGQLAKKPEEVSCLLLRASSSLSPKILKSDSDWLQG